ncbi:MAG: hypothetical protein QW629_00860, partial [Candidatus Bathyarchaeia archaeon]
ALNASLIKRHSSPLKACMLNVKPRKSKASLSARIIKSWRILPQIPLFLCATFMKSLELLGCGVFDRVVIEC